MRRFTLLLLVVLIAVPVALAAGSTVRGKVVRGDGSAYENAAVTLQGPGGGTSPVYTGSDGMFYVSNVAPGQYTIVVKSARDEKKFRVTVTAQEYTDIAPIAVN